MPGITKQDALRWLDKQRSTVNDMIVNLPQDEQRKLLPELQIINAIEERVQEMTAVEYLKARKELCNSQGCKNCPLSTHNTKHCAHMEFRMPARAVEIVKRWKEEQDES